MLLKPDKISALKAANFLKRLAGDWKSAVALIALYRFTSVVCSIFQLTLLARILSAIILYRQIGNVIILITIFFFTGILRIIVNYIADLKAAALTKNSTCALRIKIIHEIKKNWNGESESRLRSGQTLIMMSEADSIAQYLSRYLPQVLLCILVPVPILIYIAFINWIPALLLVFTAPIIPIFMIIIGKETAAKSKKHWRMLSKMNNYFLDRLKGASTLYLFNRIDSEIPVFVKMSAEYTKRLMQVLKTAFLSGSVLDFFSAVSIASVAIYTGLNLVGFIHPGTAGTFTLINSLAVLLIVPEYFSSLKKLGAYYHDRTIAVGTVMHFQELGIFNDEKTENLKAVPGPIAEIDEGRSATSPEKNIIGPAIILENVSFSYGNELILDKISLKIAPGEKIWLTGDNGAGKTTLLSLLLKWQLPASGNIFLNGNKLQNINSENLNNMISWVGQHTMILKGNIRSNILMGSEMSDETLFKDILPKVSLMKRIGEMPLGLDTPLAEDAKSLSGGERQKLALARALVKNASVLLLDEPLTHLDQESAKEFIAIVNQLAPTKTVIMTGHDYDSHNMLGYRIFNLNRTC